MRSRVLVRDVTDPMDVVDLYEAPDAIRRACSSEDWNAAVRSLLKRPDNEGPVWTELFCPECGAMMLGYREGFELHFGCPGGCSVADDWHEFVIKPCEPVRLVSKSGILKRVLRLSIPAGLRFEIFRRDKFRCVYCGRGPADGVRLHVDHVRPVSRGGTDDPSNLVTACDECNLGKGNKDLD